MPTFSTAPAVIQAGDSLSSVVDCDGGMVGIIFPGDWTSSGGISFQVSAENIDYHDLIGVNGKEVTLPIEPGAMVLVSADVGRAVRYLKIRAGSSDKPVSQKTDRVFSVVLATSSP